MESVQVFVNNLVQLQKAKGFDQLSRFVDYINEHSDEEKDVLTLSYISRIRSSLKRGEPQNVSVKIVENVAGSLGVQPWQMLCPAGFDENGISRASAAMPDPKILEESIRYAMSSAESAEIESLQFISKAAVEAYKAHITNTLDNLGHSVIKLVRQYV